MRCHGCMLWDPSTGTSLSVPFCANGFEDSVTGVGKGAPVTGMGKGAAEYSGIKSTPL